MAPRRRSSSRVQQPGKIVVVEDGVSPGTRTRTPTPATPTSFARYPASYRSPLSTPHTVTVLLGLLALAAYAVLSSEQLESADAATTVTNVKRGLTAAFAIGIVYFSQYSRDTLFVRPHVALWRAATGVGFMYTLVLGFLLFQNVSDARRLVTFLDPTLTGEPLPHRSYGDACELTYANIKPALFDIFTVAHLVGWFFKVGAERR